ncbi:hypothetical protein D5018_17850 [Parashewanella curva]|uniref:Transposase IS200-like domain-containing protein n=1 Tax=Parashewanella curva TaxID=2338552 RepID=A0A3L8PUT9_9GAMM|nr:hypothetical protein D5018_17850 [Parashewanella curva]
MFNCIQIYCGRLDCQVVELNVQEDHVHLLVKIPPKCSTSELLGAVQGRTAIRLFKQLIFCLFFLHQTQQEEPIYSNQLRLTCHLKYR